MSMPGLVARQHVARRPRPTGSLLAVMCVASALLVVSAGVGTSPAADTTWKTHRDRICGVELKYPAAYALETSGAADHCETWLRIGPRVARRIRVLFSLEIREADSTEPARSVRDLALRVATAQCAADGDDGSTYCTNAEARSPFRSSQGFRGFEVHMTEVHETSSSRKIERRGRGPVFALDLSDDEAVRVLMAHADPSRAGELKAILDTLRVWTRARRSRPRVIELSPFRGAPHTLGLRIVTGEAYRSSRWPPGPVTSWLLTDPRGHRLGRDPATGQWYAEAKAITHGSAVESGFALGESVEGRYALQVTASAPSVPYRITVQAPDQAGRLVTARHAGRTAEPGAVDRYEITYSPGYAPVVSLTEAPDAWRFAVLLSSRGGATGRPILTDPQGRQTGLDRTIPDTASGTRSTRLDVEQPADGSYLLRVTGAAPGSYTLDLRAWDRSGTVSARPELRDVPTGPGVVHVYRLDYAATAAIPLKLGGRFEADRLLAYANAQSTEPRLAAGVTSFPLVIFYGARIEPVTFDALLNGDNITGRFTPEPEGYQIVRVPLAPGLNTLVLSVEGIAGNGQAVRDVHRLVFRVD